ncbi:carbohydrate sulfotransferase 15-like [Patiria miniata]|uniref:Sulfotransferase domain-containing protein n=1 Tax=Patiria miniata TaxID=46514 RepID=A0A913ZNS4_PATMI|nr:carbohydrate sulfotransferase 15-like [Patiria miniata]
MNRLVRKTVLLLSLGVAIFALFVYARYNGLSVSVHFANGPFNVKQIRQSGIDFTKTRIFENLKSMISNDSSIQTWQGNGGSDNHILIPRRSIFQESEYACLVVMQGEIPEAAMRRGFVVENYPCARIDPGTGLYERVPAARYNSSIEREELGEKTLARIKSYQQKVWQTYRPFSPDYRNPCHVEPGKAHCLPYFHVLTGAKSGSTDFWYSLELHPLVFTTPKEPHWWTRTKGHSVARYDSVFRNFEQCIEQGKDPNIHNYVTGDGSTSSLWDNHLTLEWTEARGLGKYPAFTLADVIRALTPNARLIFLLRNPIDRLYSDYWYIYGGKSANDFDTKVRNHLKVFNDCRKREDEGTCAYRHNRGGVGHSALVGIYMIYVRDWLRRFPVEQVLFLRSDDWFKGQKPDMLLKTYHFLDIDVTKEQMKDILTIDTLEITIGRENVLRSASSRKKKHPMLASTKKLLEELYEPSNRALAALTGDDGYLWKD